ncbi:MAG: MOSC N-terminal beta barrel domain-containing protein [Burkholderiales bacterium]|nr:MOSC N-terminal beta barrel domain-containing protein [Burkholderiales bacterium]
MARIASLHTYPIKSCGGIALARAAVGEAGIEIDRLWMVVDDHGEFLSQREAPRLALVRTAIRLGELAIRAPGMLGIDLPIEVEEDEPGVVRKVSVWNDVVDAVDEGDYVAAWFSTFLGRGARLAKLHPHARRLVSRRRTGGAEIAYRFADSAPLLITAQASLDDLNLRLAGAGAPPVPMDRFRPNIVLSGLEPYAEDRIETLAIGGLVLKALKPCVRCEIPCVDQETGTSAAEPMATLGAYRADARADGGVTFGTLCVLAAGAGTTVTVGDAVDVRLRPARIG